MTAADQQRWASTSYNTAKARLARKGNEDSRGDSVERRQLAVPYRAALSGDRNTLFRKEFLGQYDDPSQ